MLWINVLLYWIIVKKNKLTYSIILLISFILPITYGLVRIKTNPATALKVAIVQPNVSPFAKGDYESRSRLINQFISLTKQAIAAKPDLIVFPETATIVDITRDQTLQDTIHAIIDSAQTYLFTGTPLFEINQPIYYNGAVLFEPNYPGFRSIYRKIHLVPFSEKIPYADKVALFRKIETNDMGNCTPGKEYTIFNFARVDSKTKRFSCLICFESIFPDLTREFTKRGADLLINVTNDGWFGKTPGPYQHCELAILRSVENGVPLIRCANNGISLIADVYARTKYHTKLFTETIVLGTVTESLSPTFYRKYGDVLIYLSIVIIVIALIVRLFKKSELPPKYYKYR
ncbi:MAG: apolipoprotein N-acyltransferase [candidate division WOR-3 bacterium]